MRQSIFDELSLVRNRQGIDIVYPNRIHPVARAQAAARACGLELGAADGASWRLHVGPAEAVCPESLKTFFSELNGFRRPYPAPVVFARVAEPVVSCVIIINENALFVQEQLLPSLAAHSAGFPVEVVLVCNGPQPRESVLAGWTLESSEWGSVAAAYNAGARASRGQYLAFFHDDCVVDDPAWIEKCLAAIEDGADVLAGEVREIATFAGIGTPKLPIAKSVPLFIRKRDFVEAGGYDEFHYVGYEDLDLTLALMQRGKKLAAAGIAMRHFNGMSSTLKYCPVPGLDVLYAMTALPRSAIRRRFREFAARGIVDHGIDFLRLALEVQLLYVLRKHRDFLAGFDAAAFARAAAELERRVTRGSPLDATQILPYFRELDRRVAGAGRPS